MFHDTDGEPWTIGASDKTFQKTKQATAVARRLVEEVLLKPIRAGL